LDGSNTESDTKSSGKGMNARTVFSDVCVLMHLHHSFIYITFFYKFFTDVCVLVHSHHALILHHILLHCTELK